MRTGYVAIVGLPNVGKSTLLNRLLKQHLSIVAPKPQTTRHRILGILNGPDYQALLLDTPGILEPKYPLQKFMKREIEEALKDADVVVLVVDANQPLDELTPVLPALDRNKTIVALNKIDRVEKRSLLPLAEELARSGLEQIFMISALNGDGVEDLKAAVVALLPEGEPLFPSDQLSDRPERFFVAEIIREAIFNRYGAEIPYATTVEIDEFKEKPGHKDYIRATIYVERDSQKAIIIGAGGRALKKTGSIAREEIERFLGRPVYLELWVKVREKWRQNEKFIRETVYRRD
ncbi:MAG: GTPase Era [candidate division WOR-3 bacterium]